MMAFSDERAAWSALVSKTANTDLTTEAAGMGPLTASLWRPTPPPPARAHARRRRRRRRRRHFTSPAATQCSLSDNRICVAPPPPAAAAAAAAACTLVCSQHNHTPSLPLPLMGNPQMHAFCGWHV